MSSEKGNRAVLRQKMLMLRHEDVDTEVLPGHPTYPEYDHWEFDHTLVSIWATQTILNLFLL